MAEKHEKQSALNKLMDFVAQRDHSELELRQKLRLRNFEPADIDWAIERAYENKWIPEAQTLAQKVHDSLDRKNKSYFYIQNYLKDKGLPGTPKNLNIEIEKISHCLNSKFPDFDGSDYEEKQKALAYLHRRGFFLEDINEVLP